MLIDCTHIFLVKCLLSAGWFGNRQDKKGGGNKPLKISLTSRKGKGKTSFGVGRERWPSVINTSCFNYLLFKFGCFNYSSVLDFFQIPPEGFPEGLWYTIRHPRTTGRREMNSQRGS